MIDRKYIITDEELAQKGYIVADNVDDEGIEAVKLIAIDLLNTRMLKLNDNAKGEKAIFEFLGDDEDKIASYKKAQFRVIYNLTYYGDNDPIDKIVNDIITFDLRFANINGFQKGWY